MDKAELKSFGTPDELRDFPEDQNWGRHNWVSCL